MSMRTVVEFNHDHGYKIEDDPEGFLSTLRSLINGGSEGPEIKNELRHYGVTVTPTHHHSTDCKVTVGKFFEKEF